MKNKKRKVISMDERPSDNPPEDFILTFGVSGERISLNQFDRIKKDLEKSINKLKELQ